MIIKSDECREPPREIPPMTKVMRRRSDGQRRVRIQGTPWTSSSTYPKTRICPSYYSVPFTSSPDINRVLSPTTFLWKNQLRALANKSPGHERNISNQTPSVSILACLTGLSRLLQLCMWLFTASQLWEAPGSLKHSKNIEPFEELKTIRVALV